MDILERIRLIYLIAYGEIGVGVVLMVVSAGIAGLKPTKIKLRMVSIGQTLGGTTLLIGGCIMWWLAHRLFGM